MAWKDRFQSSFSGIGAKLRAGIDRLRGRFPTDTSGPVPPPAPPSQMDSGPPLGMGSLTSTASTSSPELGGAGPHASFAERFSKMLPQGLSHGFPQNLEPMAIAEWAGQAVQRGGAGFYGKL